MFHLTNGRSNTRESATEIKLLLFCRISEQSPDILSLAAKALKHKNAIGIFPYFLRTKSSKGEKVCVRDHQSLWQHRELVNPTWQQETDGQRLTMLLFR